MTQYERALAERNKCREYDGPDRLGALMGELDWEAELTYLLPDTEPSYTEPLP